MNFVLFTSLPNIQGNVIFLNFFLVNSPSFVGDSFNLFLLLVSSFTGDKDCFSIDFSGLELLDDSRSEFDFLGLCSTLDFSEFEYEINFRGLCSELDFVELSSELDFTELEYEIGFRRLCSELDLIHFLSELDFSLEYEIDFLELLQNIFR